jgi:hypothetical protein
MSKRRSQSASAPDKRTTRLLRTIVSLAFVVLLAARWYTTHQNPKVTIPSPVLPSPNAFDIYLSAADAITDQKEIGEAGNPNMASLYSTAQKAAIVERNRGVIDTVHRGFAYPYLNPPIRSLFADTKFYSKFRVVAQLLSLQAQMRVEKGDWKGAAESSLDAMRLGEDIPHGSILIGALTGYSFQSMGRRSLWEIVDHLDAAQSRAAIARLTDIRQSHVSFAETLQEEKWMEQAILMDLFQGKMKPVEKTEEAEATATGVVSTADLYYLVRSKKRIMHDFTNYMDRSTEQARQRYILHHAPPPEPTDLINRILAPVFMEARCRETANETQNSLLGVALALHAYRLEEGRYPASLAELTPAYLRKLPEDPFAAQGTFQYRVKADGYILYSPGPDGRDDGGKAIDNPVKGHSSDPKARYRVSQESQGDVVAGLNR